MLLSREDLLPVSFDSDPTAYSIRYNVRLRRRRGLLVCCHQGL